MMYFRRRRSTRGSRSFLRPGLILGAVLVLGIGIICALSNWLGHSAPPSSTTKKGTPASGVTSISPLLFGSNFDLNKNKDALVPASFNTSLQDLHIKVLRITISTPIDDQALTQLLQKLKNAGIVPLLVLRGSLDARALEIDSHLVTLVHTIFGDAITYFEFGSEEDALGVTAEKYSAAWNKIIPQLKKLAPGARFVGPGNFQFDQQYMTLFLQLANPAPDAISWHEYTCDRAWSKKDCLTRISQWTDHVSAANAAMDKQFKVQLPIMITEWNYASNAATDDGKSNDAAFMHDWTTQAMQTLANNHIFASMQFTLRNGKASLLTVANQLTAQGAAFQEFYARSVPMLPTSTPTPTSPPTATPTPTAKATPGVTPTARPEPTAPSKPAYVPTVYEAESSANLLIGSAQIQSCESCSGGDEVSNIGKANPSGALIFHVNINAAGTYTVIIYYATAEARTAQISVNGGGAANVSVSSTGSWTAVQSTSIKVDLVAGDNAIMFFNDTAQCPNIDKIAI